jgi:regulatory protein
VSSRKRAPENGRGRIPRRRKPLEPAAAADARSAGAAAVALLARRDFASVELNARLLAQGFEAAVVRAVIDELGERRLIDDARFAQHFVSYHAERGQGPVRIRRELAALGLPPALVDEALEAGRDWARQAREVRIRRFGLSVPPNWAEKARQARFLQYRGFSIDHIRSALGPDFPASLDSES